MSTAELPIREGSKQVIPVPRWEDHARDNRYQCRILLCPEEEGGFSAHATRLPGVVSEGETEAEAINNIAEAFRLAIREYRASGKSVPWEDVDVELCPGTIMRWITVDV